MKPRGNAMSENNDFALAPRPSGALEKAEPGAKRILSGMVADTLALAKKTSPLDTRQKILLVDSDSVLLDCYREILVGGLPGRPEVQTATSGPRALAMLEAEPFDLLICARKMPKMDGLQILETVRRKHPELRTVMLTANTDEQSRVRAYALGVDLYWLSPATEEEVPLFLKSLHSLLERKSSLPPRKRPLRVVVLDDEETCRESYRMMLQFWYEGIVVVQCGSGDEAWEELSRTAPDLFTTDISHLGLSCLEMLRLLAANQVKYPVFVISAHDTMDEREAMQVCAQGLNVSYLSKPILCEQLRALLLKHLGPDDGLMGRNGGGSRDSLNGKPAVQTPRPRPLRIVAVYSEPSVLESLKVLLGKWFPDDTLLYLSDTFSAWEDLSRTDPDLLITGTWFPAMRGEEIVRRLLDRKADYPIIVMSTYDPEELWVRECAGRGLNIKFLSMPFDVATFRNLVAASLNIPPDKKHE